MSPEYVWFSFATDMVSRVNFEAATVCPYFSDFEFTNWNRNGEVCPSTCKKFGDVYSSCKNVCKISDRYPECK